MYSQRFLDEKTLPLLIDIFESLDIGKCGARLGGFMGYS